MTEAPKALADELNIARHLRIENGRLLNQEEKTLIVAALRAPQPGTPSREEVASKTPLTDSFLKDFREATQSLTPAPTTEPVAWRYRWAEGDEWEDIVPSENMLPTERDGWIIEPLYAAPSARCAGIERATIERCAKVADEIEEKAERELPDLFYEARYSMVMRSDTAAEIAAAIRVLSPSPDGSAHTPPGRGAT